MMGNVWEKGRETSILWMGDWGSVILIDKGRNSSKYPASLQHSNIYMNKYSCKWRLICSDLSLEANAVTYRGMHIVVCVCVCVCVCAHSVVPDCSLPASSVHGISQARILEWVAISFSRGSSQPRDPSCVSCIGRRLLYHQATWEARSILHGSLTETLRVLPFHPSLPANF